MTITTYKTIYTGNAHLVRQAIEIYDPATDRYIPFTGGTFTVSFATSADGTGPITGLQNLPLAAVAGEPGSYYAVIPPGSLTPLVALVNTIVYQIVSGGPYNGLRDVTPFRVSTARWAQ